MRPCQCGCGTMVRRTWVKNHNPPTADTRARIAASVGRHMRQLSEYRAGPLSPLYWRYATAYRPEDRHRQKWEMKIWDQYSLTAEDVARLWESQAGRCLCGKSLLVGARGTGREPWHIDHDRTTGRVRGLLHNRCNYRQLPFVEAVGIERLLVYLSATPVDDYLAVHRPTAPRRRRGWNAVGAGG